MERIITFIVDPIIRVIFTLGLFFFFYGLVVYLWKLKNGDAAGEERKHMLWGLVGMLIMVSVYGIINLIMNTLGIDFATATDASRIQNALPSQGFLGR